MTEKKEKKKSINEKLSDLALEFSITQEQIRDSSGDVKKKLEEERDRIAKEYRKLRAKKLKEML